MITRKIKNKSNKYQQQSSVIAWSGKKLKRVKPVARTRGKKTVAQLLLEDRE